MIKIGKKNKKINVIKNPQLFHASKLIERLVETEYFDTESATKYVQKRLGTTEYIEVRIETEYEERRKLLELVEPRLILRLEKNGVGCNDFDCNEEHRYVCVDCDLKGLILPQKECSHILKRKKAVLAESVDQKLEELQQQEEQQQDDNQDSSGGDNGGDNGGSDYDPNAPIESLPEGPGLNPEPGNEQQTDEEPAEEQPAENNEGSESEG